MSCSHLCVLRTTIQDTAPCPRGGSQSGGEIQKPTWPQDSETCGDCFPPALLLLTTPGDKQCFPRDPPTALAWSSVHLEFVLGAKDSVPT